MENKPEISKPVLLAITLGVASNAVFFAMTQLFKKLRMSFISIIITFLIASLIVAVMQIRKYYNLWSNNCTFLRKLGVVRLYNNAKETIDKGLQEAESSYWWLGTSAHYVLCNPDKQEYIETKPRTEFVFITIDPECSAVLSDQALWEKQPKEDIADRITDTKKFINKLKGKKINISWEGHSTAPTFRIVIVNNEKVLVSFYEKEKLGPLCKQLEVAADGLLGQWFIQFFEKSRSTARRMRIERILGRLLYKKAKVKKTKLLLDELKKLCPPGEDANRLEQIINDLSEEPLQ